MIVLVKGNTKPDLLLTLKRGGEYVPLDGATVDFKLKKSNGSSITKRMSVAEASKGRVTLAWGSGDLDVAGEAVAEIVVTYPGGQVQNGKYAIPVYIRDEFQENLG